MSQLDASAAGVLKALEGQPTLETMTPAQARQALALGFSYLQAPKVEVASVKDAAAEGPTGAVPLRVYRPRGADALSPLPAVIYIHGGGWVVGDLEVYDTLCRLLANAGDCAVVSVDYRLAPEHKFPAAAEDAIASTQWIAAHAAELGVDAAKLIVAGDSAGGNLAAVTALALRDSGVRLAGQVLIYPATDAGGSLPSRREKAEGYFLTGAVMDWFGNHYLRGMEDVSDWRASPLLAASHAGLPPAWLLVGGFDPLRDEGLAYADKLRAAGTPVEQHEAAGQIHGFMSMDGAIPEMHTYLASIGAWLKRLG